MTGEYATSGNNRLKKDNITLIRQLWELYAQYRLMLVATILCMIVVGASEPLLPWLLGTLLDSNLATVQSPLSNKWLSLVFLLVVVTRGVFTYGRSYLAGWIESTIQKDLRAQAARRVLLWSPEQMAASSAGDITSHIMFFTDGIAKSVMRLFVTFFQETVKLAGYAALLLYLQWKMALIIFIATPFVMLAVKYFKRRVKKQSKEILKKNVQGTEQLNEFARLWRIIKLQGGAAAAQERAGRLFSRFRGTQLRRLVAQSAVRPIGQIILALPCAYIIFNITVSLEAGEITPGEVSAFISAMLLMQIPVRNITTALIRWSEVAVTVRSVFAFLESPAETDDGTKEMTQTDGGVTFDRVSYAYHSDAPPALREVSFSVAPAETVALVGRSGAGKTTLANLLPRFCTPTAGAVLINGEDIRQFTLASLRGQIALVTQEPLLFDDTVAFNVAYPDGDAADSEKINRALKDAAAAEFVADLPQKADTPVGENGGRLSGGQRQRIALARAFYRDAPIVILDEATSSLDAETEVKIRAAMQRLLAGRTAIIIAHRFSTINFADRVVVLDEGRIVASGRSDELLQTCPLYAELYRTQQLP